MKQIIGIFLFLLTISLLPADSTEQPYRGWLKTDTEHFTIIYEDISRESVKEIVEFCEDVYKSVTAFFGSYPEKIIVVLRDRVDFSNGSYNPAPAHINIYLTTPGTPELGAGVDNWLRFVLTHELVHYVNMNMEEGLFYNISRILGKSVASVPGGLIPGWAIEGIAVKLETDLTEGGRGDNPFFEIFSKSMILENKMFSWRQAAYSSIHPPSGRIYIAGYILNDYLARNYGNDIFVRVYREFLKFPLPGFNYYLKKITGNSISTIFTAMKTELKEKYQDSISEGGGKIISTDAESDYYLPVITDAGWICYRKTAAEEPGIVIINPETMEETVLVKTRLTDYSSLTASQNGNLIAFTSLNIRERELSGLIAGSDLYIYNRNTRRTKRITYNSHLRQPAISSDGRRIVSVQTNGQYSRLVEVDISTGDIRVIYDEMNRVFNPVFSKNGEFIAFTVQRDNERAVWLTDSNGTTFPLTADISGNDYAPTFTSNNTIVFVSDMTGTPDLYETSIDSVDDINKIYSDPAGIFSGVIEKNRIIYSTWSPGGYTLKEAQYNPDSSFLLEKYREQNNDSNSRNLSPMTSEGESGFTSNKYRDIPKMIVTLPVPFFIDPLYESNQIFGPGFSSYFQSVLGKNIINITATLNTDTRQPGVTFNFIHDWGPVSLDYSLLQGYAPTELNGLAYQTTNQKLLFNFPIVSNKTLGLSTYFGLFTGFMNSFSIVSNTDFTFLEQIPENSSEYISSTYQINGIGFSMERNSPVRDMIPPGKIVSSALAYTPVNSDFFKHFAFKFMGSVNLPSPIPHQVIRVSSRFTYSEIENLGYINNPRGFPGDSPGTGGVIPAIDYLFTVALPDLPVLGGLSLQGIAGAVHMEKIFGIEKGSIFPDDNIYGGIELLLLGNYINVFETVGIGMSYRFTPGRTEFDISNMGIYIFTGKNSFTQN